MFIRFRLVSAFACVLMLGAWAEAQEAKSSQDGVKSVQVGTFPQQVSHKYSTREGLPSNDIQSVAVLANGDVVAGTPDGVGIFSNGQWSVIPESQGIEAPLVAAQGNVFIAIADGTLYRVEDGDIGELGTVPSGQLNVLVASAERAFLGTDKGLYELKGDSFEVVDALNSQIEGSPVRHIAIGPEGRTSVAAGAGLFESTAEGWQKLYPRNEQRSWAPHDVRAVAYDTQGRLWFASPQGVGVREGEAWILYTGQEGLPYNDFTSMAADPDGSVWFGTKIGAIRFDGKTWEYREGQRWLPGNEVRGVIVGPQGGAWFATDAGVGRIEAVPMTLAQKARMYEDAIDKFHRRTPYGFVLEVGLPAPGDTGSVQQHDSDNDGLWTSMYGAGECFAYGATKEPYFKERARKAFEALRFLMDVTQGGTPPSQPGFVARTVLPTSGPNPNEGEYTPEKDRQKQQGDKLWKVMDPRWGTSADGQWYWKSDTSSDELDGHYFFHACYYDLVCETEAEKEEVRKVIVALTDHLVRNNFQLVDHDGQPTRWAVYNPERFNQDLWWFMERGLNSLSILSYLATAHHMTGDAKYSDAIQTLLDQHGYHINMQYPKFQVGPGSGNQSDDEMAFMSYYNLMKYTPKNTKLYDSTAFSFWNYWQLERWELNPLFNFMFASQIADARFTSAFSNIPLAPRGHWLEQSVDTLKRFPLDRFNWKQTNSHRIDIDPLPNYMRDPDEVDSDRPFRKGRRQTGLVLPVDERFFNHWNHDPYQLDEGGNGQELATGAVFLLPYYMGLYHGFITE